MLFPFTRVWTPRQKALIIGCVAFGLVSFGALIYGYERYYRGPGQEILYGTWTRVDAAGGGGHYDFRRDGTIVMLGDDGQPTDIKGKWYAGGPNIYVRFPAREFLDRLFAVWHIVDISRDQFRVDIWRNNEGLAVWRRMKPVPRAPVDVTDISITEAADVEFTP